MGGGGFDVGAWGDRFTWLSTYFERGVGEGNGMASAGQARCTSSIAWVSRYLTTKAAETDSKEVWYSDYLAASANHASEHNLPISPCPSP